MGRLFVIMTNFLVMALIFSYGYSILSIDTLQGKNETTLINDGLQRLQIQNPRWTTIVASGSITTNKNINDIWIKWQHLENWKDWSPVVKDAALIDSTKWGGGVKFEQTLKLGFPYGTITINDTVTEIIPKEKVVWCKDSNLRYCVIWTFKTENNQTTITSTEVYDGIGYALIKPFVHNKWQLFVEQRLNGLVS